MPHQVKKQGDDYKKSTWREQVVTVVPGDITTVYFDDTKPNHSSITNNTNQIVYVHTSPSVSATNHLLMVSPGSTKVLARPLGYYQIYLSAAVTETSKVRVESWEEKFTVNSVTQSMDMVQLGQMTGTVDISKMPPLSAGSNKIGSVDVTNPVTLGSSVIPPTEPIPTREAGMNDFRVGGLIVGLTSVAAKSGSSPLPNRRELTIYPPATGTVYWGKQGVKPSTGAPLTSNDSPITFKLHSQSPTIHLVSDNEVNVTVVEVS
ncbi:MULTISPECIES: hypothetical protein [Bacillus subtilis group]|uniref:hypothetical protein n=1 Tax=Bacillus subtilis group TaxID=653685 RepID=UPI0022810274|nr:MULTISPECIES: hypothetical protein [Bacillus subtilis group]MCY8467202.1 hypothetical protein [Bacillus atrophaeus]MCY8475386.1 hypothetical protein [Bacillus halotolerans]MCY8479754.1 hypothetical protein [Bacillus atrophaeus]